MSIKERVFEELNYQRQIQGETENIKACLLALNEVKTMKEFTQRFSTEVVVVNEQSQLKVRFYYVKN